MAKDKRPKPVRTNRTALEEYLSQTDTDVVDQDAPESTESPILEPDYFFRDKKVATGGPKGLERKAVDDGKRFQLPAEKDTFEDVIQPRTELPSTTSVKPFEREKFQRNGPDYVQDEEEVLLQQLMETSNTLRDQSETVDKKNKNQVAEFNKVVDLYNNTMNRLKEVNPVWNMEPDMIANHYRTRDLYRSLASGKPEQTISKFDPERLVSVPGVPIDVKSGLLKEETQDDKQKAYNYQLLIKALNRDLPISEAEKESDIRGTKIGRLGGSFIQGVLSIPEGFVGMGEMLADETGIEPLKKIFQKQGQQIQQAIDGVAPQDADYAEQLFSALGSQVSFLIPGMAAASFGNLAKVTPNLAKWMGVGTSAILESVTEAGLVYKESNSSEAATKTFLANLLMVSLTNRYGLFADEMKPLKRTLMSTGLEGLQEGVQEIISQASQGKEVNWKQVIESLAIGGIVGGGSAFVQKSAEEKEEPETFEDVLTPTKTQPSQSGPGDASTGAGIQKIADVLNTEGIAKLQDKGVDFNPDLGRGKIYVRDTTVKDDKGAAAVYSIPTDQFTPEKVIQTIELGRKKFEKATEPIETTEKIEQGTAPIEKIKPEKVEGAEIPAEDKGVDDRAEMDAEELQVEFEKTPLSEQSQRLVDKAEEFANSTDKKVKDIADDIYVLDSMIKEQFNEKFVAGEEITEEDVEEVKFKVDELIAASEELAASKLKPVKKQPAKKEVAAKPEINDIVKKVEGEALRVDQNKFQKIKGENWVSVTNPKTKFTRVLKADAIESELERFRKEEAASKKPEVKPKKVVEIKTPDDLQKASTIDVRNFVKNEIGNEAFTKLMEDAVAEDDSPVIEGKTKEEMQGYAIDAAVHAKAMELVEQREDVRRKMEDEKTEEKPKLAKDTDKRIKWIAENYPDKQTRFRANRLKEGFSDEFVDAALRDYPELKKNSDLLAKGFKSVLDVPLADEVNKRSLKEFQDEFGFYFEGDRSKNYFKGSAEEFYNQVKKETPSKDRIVEPTAEEVKAESAVSKEKQPWEMTQAEVSNKKAEKIFPIDSKVEIKDGKPIYTYWTTVKFGDEKRTFEIESRSQPNATTMAERLHKKIIQQAINEGKIESHPDYPDLQKPEQKITKKITEPEKPSVEQVLKQKIYDNLQYVNDKKQSGKARLQARNEAKLQTQELLKSGVAAQLKNESGKWNLYIDNVKQDKRSLGLVEKVEKVDITKIEYREEVSKPFEQILREIRDRQEIIAESFVEAEDLPSGSGQAVLDKGLKDIQEDAGKEVSPEAMVVREAAEFIFKNGKSVIRMKHFPKQDLLPEEIWLFVDERVEEKAIQELNEMEEAGEEERVSAEAVIETADDLEQRIDEADTVEEIQDLANEIDEVAGDLFGEAKKLGHKKKSIFAEQTSFADLAKSKVPDKGITGEGKGEETTPLFQQPSEVKGQQGLFEDQRKDFIENVKYTYKKVNYGQGTDLERSQHFYDYEYKGKKYSTFTTYKIREKDVEEYLFQDYTEKTTKPAESIAEKPTEPDDIGYGTVEEEKPSSDAIEDFGDKIGGARKDTAESGYEMTGGKKIDETPAWMKGFRTGLKEDGTFQPFFATERGFIQWRSRDVYATEEEAITAIKLFNVTQRFRVSGNDQGYEIYRKVTNKKLVSIKKEFKTRDEAYKYIVDHADEFLEYKPQFPERPHIEDLQRTGKEYRKGDVTPDQFRKVFNFKGGEFGNWVPQDERQRILNMAFDGLMDLSDILGVPPEALSLGGNLSIAFGSRGHGLTGAQAHYEPDRAVFNLTRIKGAGSVAHEWFHAFDHYFGFQDRGKKLIKNEKGVIELAKDKEREYISYGSVRAGKVRQEVAEAFKDVVNTIYKQPKIIEVSIERFTKGIERNTQYLEQSIKQLRDYISQERSYGKKKAAATPEQLKKYDQLTEKIKKGDLGEDAVIKTKQTAFGGMFSEIKTKQVFKDLNDLLKEITGRGHYKYDGGNVKTLDDYAKKISYDQSQYEHYVLNNKEQRDTPTKFYYDAKDLDKMRVSDYWSMKHEMAARAFESYIEDRIKQTGNLSQYLVHSTENSVYKVLYDLSPYPEGVERERINDSFDNLFKKVGYRSSYDEKFGTLYSYMKDAQVFDVKDLAEKSGQPPKDVSEALNDLAKRKLVNRVPGGYEPTDEFRILLSDLNEHPEKYGDDFNTLYSNPLPAIVKGVSRTITAIDDIYKKYVGDKVYKALGSVADKITPEKVKQLILTNYGLPTEYIAARREAYDALQRYKELAKEIGDNLLIKNPLTGEKFTDAEQKRLSQVIKGSVTMNPLIGARAMQAIREIKELEKLGKDLEVLPLETYNSKLPRKRIQELLQEKEKLNKQRNKIIRGLKFEKDLVLSPELADELNATQKRALKRATKNIDQKIEDIHKKIVNRYVHGGEGYLKRVYLTKEQTKNLAKYGFVRPTRLDLTSAMHRKDIPYEIRKEMGEILTAAYPAAKGIMLEGKDVSFGRFFEVISENPDWASETEVQGWTKLPEDTRLGKLSEKYVEPRIADDINDVMKFTSDEELDKFLKKINATWKATKTIMNPATHLRNIYSNTIMLDFSGVPHTDQLRILPDAIRAVKGQGKYAQQFKASRLNNTTFTTQELGEYLDIAAEDRGFLDMSLPDKLVKIYGKATLVDTKVGQFMGKVYQMEEVLGKAVKFISEIEKGKSIIEARQEANKWMFDYSEIPSLIRRLRTNPIFGMPFVTWSYKAFPRIIETAITRPITFWKYPVIFSALLQYALKTLGIDDDDWEKIKADLPERMIKGEWLLMPFRDAKGKLQMLDLTYILPYKDVYDVIESGFSLATSGELNNSDDIVDGILGLVQAPILKTTAELLTNRDTYTNQQIWFDIDSPAEKMQKAFDHMYKTFMPSLAPEIPFLSQGGYAYHKIRSVLSDRDDYYGRTFSLAPALTSVMLGIKTSPIEPEKNIERKEAKLQNELIQLATKENQILRDGSLSEDERLAKAMELERDKEELRKQLAGMEIPVKNPDIASTEKAIRSLQAKYGNVDLNNTKLREKYATEINKLKIKLNELLSNPDAYTGETKKKEPEKRGKQFNKSKTLQFQKEL